MEKGVHFLLSCGLFSFLVFFLLIPPPLPSVIIFHPSWSPIPPISFMSLSLVASSQPNPFLIFIICEVVVPRGPTQELDTHCARCGTHTLNFSPFCPFPLPLFPFPGPCFPTTPSGPLPPLPFFVWLSSLYISMGFYILCWKDVVAAASPRWSPALQLNQCF